ncbi:MAG: hypothetical protein R3D68_19180 [Hyphomicrobiaceae bacterium]
MAAQDPKIEERLALVKATGLSMNAADDKRVGDSVRASLMALDAVASGSMFDTEPLHFERALKAHARKGDA